MSEPRTAPVRSLRRQVAALAAPLLRRLGFGTVSLREEDLLAQARSRTGFADFGDSAFLPAFRALRDSLDGEARLSPPNRQAVRNKLIELLSRRLYIQHDLQRFPEILEAPIVRPIMVVGMPRSGTTLLNSLLLQDPGCRWLREWEAEEPWPERGTPEENDPRRIAHQMRISQQAATNPKLDAIHSFDAPGECHELFLATFVCRRLASMADTPSYDRFLSALPPEGWIPAYAHYRQQLQRLFWYRPGTHWVLKSAYHLGSLDALLAVMPDACIVHLHRDPRKVVPSAASMHVAARSQTPGDPDLEKLSGRLLANLSRSATIATERRRHLDSSRFFDLQYTDLVRDPLGSVRRIYTAFGFSMTPAMEEGMAAWMAENPQHKKGVHRYTLEQFGLTPEKVDAAFAAYREHFQVTTK